MIPLAAPHPGRLATTTIPLFICKSIVQAGVRKLTFSAHAVAYKIGTFSVRQSGTK
jgi:hypothetical protein